MKYIHKTVLREKLINSLRVENDNTIVDCTLGGGGHTLEVLRYLNEKGKIVCIDLDKKAIGNFQEKLRLQGFEEVDNKFVYKNIEIYLVLQNFEKINEILNNLNLDNPDVIYADLGLSNMQISKEFSFQKDGELDLRFDKTSNVKASDLLNALYVRELTHIFKEYGDIKQANILAKEIIKRRNIKPLRTKNDLVKCIERTKQNSGFLKGSKRSWNIEQRVFQALRIAVNKEYEALERMLNDGFEILKSGGRIGIISFHSGEDRIVKSFMKKKVKENIANWIIEIERPSKEEIAHNRMARSSILRVIEKK